MMDAPSLTYRVYKAETRYQLLGAWRTPGAVLPTLCFPAFFYIFFGLLVDTPGSASMPTYLLATFGTFGVIAPALFSFGIAVAGERGAGWLRLKLASPMPASAYLVSKLIASAVFSLSVVLLLYFLGGIFGGVTLSVWRWTLLAVVLVLGSVPFCALGLWIGLWVNPQAAPAIINLVYLPISFLSGLWLPMMFLPPAMEYVAWILPPFHLAQLALWVVGFDAAFHPLIHLCVLCFYGIVFFALAIRAWRRNVLNER